MPGSVPCRLLLTGALSALLLTGAGPQNRIPELQAQFNRESDPVRKVKALGKLGDAQFEQLRRETHDGNYGQALRRLEEYRDEVRVAEAALRASGVDAERKPSGFKQLQIHVRKSLREIDQIILVLPDSERPQFDAVRRDLAAIDKELIDLLFPRQPGKSAEKEKPKG
jgi:hypothetical protein